MSQNESGLKIMINIIFTCEYTLEREGSIELTDINLISTGLNRKLIKQSLLILILCHCNTM